MRDLKTKIVKKTLACFLALAMVVTMMPVGFAMHVNAAELETEIEVDMATNQTDLAAEPLDETEDVESYANVTAPGFDIEESSSDEESRTSNQEQGLERNGASNLESVGISNEIAAGISRTMPKNPVVSEDYSTWDCVWLGNYWKTNNTSKEPIKWRVLEVNGNQALLLAEDVLDKQFYKYSQDSATWETSDIRSWLGGTFLGNALSSKEQNAIIKKTLSNNTNPIYGTAGGNNTTDSVFLLSVQDVMNQKYGFHPENVDSNTRRSKGTPFHGTESFSDDSTPYCLVDSWMLRSPGIDNESYMYVSEVGGLNSNSFCSINSVMHTRTFFYGGVRPALYLDLNSDVWSYAGTVSSDPEGKRTISFKYNDDEKNLCRTHNALYSNEYFEKSSYDYNHDLAYLTLCMELSSWTADLSTWGETGSTAAKSRYAFIEDAYEQMGFTNAQYYNYDKTLNSRENKVAFSIAKNPKTGVIAIVVRGGGYGCEWASNFDVGNGKSNHKGFNDAADEVYEKAIKYIQGQSGSAKVWITGYSRGAAVANIVAGKLNNYADKSSKLSRKSIYAYTFATPQGVLKSSNLQTSKNIFNIINPVDVVPNVAPSGWGYARNGQTKYLNIVGTRVVNNVEDNYKALTGNKINISKNLDYSTQISALMKVVTNAFPTAGGCETLQKVLGDVLEFKKSKKLENGKWVAMTEDDYYNVLMERYGNEKFIESYQYSKGYLEGTADGKLISSIVEQNAPDLKPVIKLIYLSIYIHGGDKDIKAIDNALLKVLKGRELLDTFRLLIRVVSNIPSDLLLSHTPEVYLAWMQTDASKDTPIDAQLFYNQERRGFGIYSSTIKCPVDVFVYDEGGNLVAEVRNHEIVDASIPVTTDTEETTLYFSDLQKYKIKIVPYDNGTMDYITSEMDGEGTLLHQTSFENVQITKNVPLESTLCADSNNDIDRYDLETDGVTIKPDAVVKTKDISDFEASLSVPAFRYDGNAKTPKVTVKGLVEGRDYFVYYTDNIEEGDASATVVGQGLYSGSKTISFKIYPASSYEIHYDPDGGKILNGYYDRDKEIYIEDSYPIFFQSTQSFGLPVAEKDGYKFGGWVKTKGIFSGQSMYAVINWDEDIYLKAEWYKNPDCSQGHSYGSYVVVRKAKCRETGLKTKTCTECGHTYSATIPATGHKWNTAYTIDKKATYAAAGSKSIHCSVCNVKKSGSIVKIPKVVPAKTSIKSLTRYSKAFTVKWTKKNYTGYQIRYSLKSTMASPKAVTITKATTLSKKITNLKAKKKYYVQVRTYKTYKGKKYYSPWSVKKAVTTK